MNVRVEGVEVIDSALLGLGIGVVVDTGERIIFALPKKDGREVQRSLAEGARPTIAIDPSYVLSP